MFHKIMRKLVIVLLAYIAGISVVFSTYFAVALWHNLHTEVVFVYKVLPVLVIEDPNHLIIRSWSDGGQIGSVIIMEKLESNESIIKHELTHVKQNYSTFFVGYILLYELNTRYRLLAEYEAYTAEGNLSQKEIVCLLLGYSTDMTMSQITNIIEEYNGLAPWKIIASFAHR